MVCGFRREFEEGGRFQTGKKTEIGKFRKEKKLKEGAWRGGLFKKEYMKWTKKNVELERKTLSR